MDTHQSLRDRQRAFGAQVSDASASLIPASFGNDAAAFDSAHQGVALYDRTHWGRIQVGDRDCLRFLHNQTTNHFQDRQPGEGCDTVFVTSTARTLDLATAYVLEDAVMLLVSPGQTESLITWMDQFIFFADQVSLADLTADTATFSLIGSQSSDLLTTLGAESLLDGVYGSHRMTHVDGIPVRVAVGSGVAIAGYTLITDAHYAADLWERLVKAGALALGETVWERLRIEQGRPLPAHELTEDFNPLEAGLWHTISLTKGCYIGQETIARLHTYRGVKQQLWGVTLGAAVAPGTPVMAGDDKVGLLTSLVPTPDGFLGLAYLRTKAIESGLDPVQIQVQIQGVDAKLMPLPFVHHGYPQSP